MTAGRNKIEQAQDDSAARRDGGGKQESPAAAGNPRWSEERGGLQDRLRGAAEVGLHKVVQQHQEARKNGTKLLNDFVY